MILNDKLMKLTKSNKKEIASGIVKSIEQAITNIQHVKQGKKLKRLVAKASKKVAEKIVEQQKRELKKQKQTEKSLAKMEKALGGKEKKATKEKKKKDA